ncbi:serine/threonine-protein kinase pim-2-like [Bolinopsis microptera]|uniref:serine/threonine-protein kinase pim-2-like n=1 Tax=Bolinopsis microptera TaxID=2820187 RepID=UPI003079B59C
MYCRSKKIDHRDIKDENILYNPNTKHVMLIDFGSASFVSSSYNRLQGTDIYHPPEFFSDGSFKSTDGIVWALGSFAYILLNGDCPYDTLEDLKDDVPIVWTNEKSSSSAIRFVRRALRRRPVDREPLNLLRKSAWLNNFKK